MDLKNFKPGYQGKPDAMREMAERLAGSARGREPEIIFSKSAADRERIRPYKKGGMVSKDGMTKKFNLSTNHHIEKMKKEISKEEEMERKEKMKKEKAKADEQAYKKGGQVKGCDERQKYADGGMAYHIRLGQANPSGTPIIKKKKSYTTTY